MVRTLACQARGHGFKSRRPRHQIPIPNSANLSYQCYNEHFAKLIKTKAEGLGIDSTMQVVAPESQPSCCHLDISDCHLERQREILSCSQFFNVGFVRRTDIYVRLIWQSVPTFFIFRRSLPSGNRRACIEVKQSGQRKVSASDEIPPSN